MEGVTTDRCGSCKFFAVAEWRPKIPGVGPDSGRCLATRGGATKPPKPDQAPWVGAHDWCDRYAAKPAEPVPAPLPRSGPRPAYMTCAGCPSLTKRPWSEPSGDGETMDSGTENLCAAHGERAIDGVYGAVKPYAPSWCPAAEAPQPAPAAEFDLVDARRLAAHFRGLAATAETWVHAKRGSRYWIQAVAIRETDGEPMVIYRDSKKGTCWVRPAFEFFDGRFRRDDGAAS